jgi:diguanylate cyclase (GGDEF)-like protein
MKLYNKFLNGIWLLAAIFIIIMVLLSNSILLNDFSKIEEKNIGNNMERVYNTIDGEVNNISAFVQDYSVWNDSHTFSIDRNEEFINSNFSDFKSFEKFGINFIIYTDKDDNIILSKGLNLNENTEEALSGKMEKEIMLKVKQISFMKHSEKIKGITEINNTPTILVTEPITTSDGKNASGGHIISGRFLDENQIAQLSSNVMVDLELEKYKEVFKLKKNLKWFNNMAIENTNEHSATGYKVLLDLEDHPYLMIKINVNRDIHEQAIKSITYFVIIIILISIGIVSVILFYLKEVVIKRIRKMDAIIHKISDSKDLTLTMKTDGNDEIASLAVGFNNMLGELGKYGDKIEVSRNKYYSLISNMITCFSYNKIIFNKEGVPIDFLILDGNNALYQYLGLQRDEVVGKKISEFLGDYKINIRIFNTFTDVAMHGGQKKIDEVYFENSKRWLTASAYSIEEGYFALMFSDITENKKVEARNLELANIDMLTGLPNRKMIIETIDGAIDKKKNYGGKFAILFIDLDDFKRVNDSLGHGVGDVLIQKVGARLKSVISSSDVVSRIGGDEFIILQDNINSVGEAEILAMHIRNVLKESFIHLDNELYTAVSIGISIYPDDGVDISNLMKNSDIAMYEAKKNGGNCYRIYSGNMNKAGLTNLILESNLYKALEKKEMLLYFQAITHVKSKSIIGFEALIRWNHNGKIIPPSDFIPMAENNGYIIQLGKWVINEACRQCSEWQSTGIDTYVTVNITFKQLEQPDFVDIVINALKKANIDSKYLVLEITENDAMQNVDLTIKTLNIIKTLGVSIALDDFGTGYSSLSYVNRLPIDILKIDRSLIMNIAHSTQNIAIIKAIIAMASSLSIKVVVEGVEDIEQFIILEELKSYAIQGYLVSKPLPAEEVRTFMDEMINLP